MVPFQTKGGRFLPWTDRREVVTFYNNSFYKIQTSMDKMLNTIVIVK